MSGAVAAVSSGASGGASAPASAGSSGGSPAPSSGQAANNNPTSAANNNTATPANGQAPKNGAPKEAAKPELPKRFQYKKPLNGKEVEVDLDYDDAFREIQKSRHYDKTRGEFESKVKAFEQRQQEFEARMQAFAQDPEGYLEQQGISLQQIAQAKAAREAELAQFPPEVREMMQHTQKLEAELKRLQETAQQRELSEKQAAEQREAQELVNNTARTLDEAIKLSGLKRSGELLNLYGEVMEMAVRNGEPPLSIEQIVHHGERLRNQRLLSGLEDAVTNESWRVKNSDALKKLSAVMFDKLSDAELMDFVGRPNVTRLTKAGLSVYRKNPVPTVAEASPTQPQQTQPQRTFDTPQSMHAILDKLASR